jgi:protein TonB
MCGSRPQGPTQEQAAFDIYRYAQQQAQTQRFIDQSNQQQAAMAQQLAQQQAATEAQTLQRQQELAAEQAAAAADAASRQTTTYATATESEAPIAPLTTAEIKPKKKAATSLRITPGSTEATAGAGLNLGV